MNLAKLEARLQVALKEAQAQRRPGKLRVLIEHRERVNPDVKGTRRQTLQKLEEQVIKLQARIEKKLHDLGVREPLDRQILSNSLVVELTPAQISAITDLEDVRIVRLITEEQVTC